MPVFKLFKLFDSKYRKYIFQLIDNFPFRDLLHKNEEFLNN